MDGARWAKLTGISNQEQVLFLKMERPLLQLLVVKNEFNLKMIQRFFFYYQLNQLREIMVLDIYNFVTCLFWCQFQMLQVILAVQCDNHVKPAAWRTLVSEKYFNSIVNKPLKHFVLLCKTPLFLFISVIADASVSTSSLGSCSLSLLGFWSVKIIYNTL